MCERDINILNSISLRNDKKKLNMFITMIKEIFTHYTTPTKPKPSEYMRFQIKIWFTDVYRYVRSAEISTNLTQAVLPLGE